MASRLILIACILAVLGVAAASRDLASPDTGRQLLQTTSDCSRSVPHCSTCRYQFYKGSTTKAICTQCETGFIVKAGGRACWCAPGYYKDGSGNCVSCGTGNWCPGSKSTFASATQNACGDNKVTTNTFAKSDRECVAKAGFGWGSAGAEECAQGFYNPGYNTRKCTKCPGSLTTINNGTTSSTACQAPAGYYYSRGRAVACARGTYKGEIANGDCAKCLDGFTTPLGTTAQTDKASCSVLLPGYSAPAGTAGSVTGEACEADHYRADEVDFAGALVACTACPDNMKTLPNVTAATSVDACLAPPGYGWDKATEKAVKCTVGTYNPGWNREPCTPCGDGILTDAEGSTSEDDCYIPVGFGSSTNGTAWTAEVCPKDTYGRQNKTYGLVEVECTKCMDHAHTNSTGATSAADCVTEPGYGWADGQVLQCEYGFWSSGYTQNPCTYCGDNFNTTSNTTTAIVGATSADSCRVDQGWTRDANGVQLAPCTRGHYKELYGDSACVKCPSGTTTTITLAAQFLSDCNTCRPGFGSATAISTSAPACTICASGTYAAGFRTDDLTCQTCPQAANFTGAMVSRKGVSSPEECLGEFISDAGLPNFQEWDIIPMASGLTNNSAATVDACQAACAADGKCQYYVFTSYSNWCQLRLSSGAFSKITNIETPNIVLFEVKGRQYVAYSSAGAVADIGETIRADYLSSSFDTAKADCDKDSSCAGLTFDGTHYRTFSGSKWEGAVAKVRVVGEAINSWIDEPTAN